ncbi:MAG: hypothetical protein A2452_06070 [Candidatus Firestonebacteria bacterium RIFOXYC2_FULL_39_67]|nr:MAG: hypothetical protein A2536_12395 [Candidatus Firestonebacteria bacterium RIFOXYD2_FULL_39_29]OGF56653.1 MAG: hypothetical protein A2452_06070 [Candidatus Firestonebacteria bacterium RIFOXYC2_FULL_39_67]OGF57128.1 MAG: hypothetical protein A2497_04615 [Candidatus Firestonebacteria bacterium RifOxyC12_full_39_7]
MYKKAIKILLITAGTVSVGLGILGIFLPLLPTTPFLLLAAVCYSKGSERLYNWLLKNRYFGSYIKNYREKKGIPLRAKITAIVFLNITMGYTIFFIIHYFWLKVMLFLIAVGVVVHICSMKTLNNGILRRNQSKNKSNVRPGKVKIKEA